MASKFKRTFEVIPAYDKRPKYGIHGAEWRWYLRGSKGTVQFVIYTNWMLPSVNIEQEKPMAADLGYHAKRPLYVGQYSREDCSVLNSKRCYYDGSTLNAEPVLELLITKGSEAVWQRLEDYYHGVFDTKGN